MFVVKKSLIIAFACLLALSAIIGICADVAVKYTSATNPNLPTVVIDAGHGGIDAGVRGTLTNEKESDINLAIAMELRGYFVNAGFNCVMTRTTQGGLYENTSKGFKKRDMLKRKQAIENCNADLVISIHQNSCPLPSRRGGQVFFNAENDKGKELALSIQDAINEMQTATRISSPLAGDYFMLKCSTAPSVIVECGFLTNAEDEKLLTDINYQKEISYAIFKGAVSFLG